MALSRNGKERMIPPRGTLEMEAGDHLVIAGDPGQVARMRARARAGD